MLAGTGTHSLSSSTGTLLGMTLAPLCWLAYPAPWLGCSQPAYLQQHGVSMPDVLLQTVHAREGHALPHHVLHCRCLRIRSSFSLCSKKLLQQRHARVDFRHDFTGQRDVEPDAREGERPECV